MTIQLIDEALTTLATVKNVLGITDTAQDDELTRMINAVSQTMARFCNRRFDHSAAITEKIAGFGGRLMMISRTPLLNIAEVKINDTVVEDVSIYNADEGFIYRKTGWPWSVRSRSNYGYEPLPGDEELNVEVTYEGGYVTPAQAAGSALDRTLPYDLEQLCIDAVVSATKGAGENKFVTSESLMSASYSYDRASSLIPSGVFDALKFSGYVRIV